MLGRFDPVLLNHVLWARHWGGPVVGKLLSVRALERRVFFASVGESGRPHYPVKVGTTGSNPVGGAEVHPPSRVLTSSGSIPERPPGPLGPCVMGTCRGWQTASKTVRTQLSQLGWPSILAVVELASGHEVSTLIQVCGWR